MAYLEVPDSDLDADSPLTETLMIQLNDNIKSNRASEVTGGNSHNHVGGDGAAIPEGGLDTAAVNQGNLKTTIGEVSTTSTGMTSLTLPGGEYGFYPQLKVSASGMDVAAILFSGNEIVGSGNDRLIKAVGMSIGSYITSITLGRDSDGSSGTISAQQRYVQASPPYDLGNGEIPLFMFVVIDNVTGLIESTYIAEDPPWAYNGKHRLDPQKMLWKNGKRFIKRNKIPFTRKEALLDREKLFKNIEAIKKPVIEEMEITQEIKNKDMIDIPHPFMGNDLTGKSIVLLDPCGDICIDLYEMSKVYDGGVSEVTNILLNDSIVLSNSHKEGLITPDGVMGVSMKWK